jgi:hypothetical protein
VTADNAAPCQPRKETTEATDGPSHPAPYVQDEPVPQSLSNGPLMARTYSPQDVERGLTALAVTGSDRKASEACGIPRATLKDWRQRHAERLAQIQRDRLPEIAGRVASEFESLIRKGIDVQVQIFERMRAEVANLAPRELSGALKNAAIATGVATDKSRLLRELPTEIREQRPVHEIEAELRRRGWIIDDDSAEEIGPPPLVTAAESEDAEGG